MALFNLAIDSKLRGCDLVALRVKDLGDAGHISSRAIVMQIQLLLGHTKLESTVRYRGIEVDDALEMAEQTEV